ncbi:MAG TPA: hypothetical protein VF676_00965 [Flavobacterium sp.]|jgi:hypothetical protein
MTTQNNQIREDKPGNTNPDEVGVNHPAKNLHAQEKVDIKESEIGRETSQMPATEHIEQNVGQIDDQTVKMHQQAASDKELGKPMESESETEEGRDNAGYENDITGPDSDDKDE